MQGRLRRRLGLTVLVAALAAQLLGIQPAHAASSISVEKTATPESRPAPGGDFTFNIVATNSGDTDLTIATLTDDQYGDLTTRPGSTCNTAPGTVLVPGATYSCSFVGPFNGVKGDSQTDIVTVTATDPMAVAVGDTDDATVTLTASTPTVTTNATAMAPLGTNIGDFATVTGVPGVPVPTGDVSFVVYGPTDTTCGGPVVFFSAAKTISPISPNSAGVESNEFTPGAPGQYRWRASYSGDDNYSPIFTECNAPNETSTVVAPSITVTKSASPTSLPEPGGTFTFSVVVTNTGIQDVQLVALVDSVYGDLAGQGTCAMGLTLAPGETFTCSFQGDFMGVGGDTQTNAIFVQASDEFGNSDVAFSNEVTVTITDIPPLLLVTKTPLPPTLAEPGGNYVTTLVVKNIGGENVTITDLTDSIYGDVTDLIGDCEVGVVIEPDDTYECFFITEFIGVQGQTQTNTLVVTATDDDDNISTISDTATVRIVAPLPAIDVFFSASPPNRPAPGGFFTFTVSVANTGRSAVTLAALLDDVDGYLGGKGNCPYTVAIPVGATFTCTFADEFRGSPGDVQLRTVRAIVTNIDGNSAIDNDDALISLTAGPSSGPSAVVSREAGPSAPALVVTGPAGTTSAGPALVTPAALASSPTVSSAALTPAATASVGTAGASGPATAGSVAPGRSATSASAGSGTQTAAVGVPATASRAVVASSAGNLSGTGTAAVAMLVMGLSLVGGGQLWRRFRPPTLP